jgi:hypothetical protein
LSRSKIVDLHGAWMVPKYLLRASLKWVELFICRLRFYAPLRNLFMLAVSFSPRLAEGLGYLIRFPRLPQLPSNRHPPVRQRTIGLNGGRVGLQHLRKTRTGQVGTTPQDERFGP